MTADNSGMTEEKKPKYLSEYESGCWDGEHDRMEEEKEIFGPLVEALERLWKNPHECLLYRSDSDVPIVLAEFYRRMPTWKK